MLLEPILNKAHRESPHWSNDILSTWDDADYRRLEPFVNREYWTDQGSVNVFRVIGTQHWDYQGKSWINLLETGKRMDINLGLHAKKPEYYRQQERKKPMMYYLTYDGLSFYVGSDGNHRTCIARFDFHYNGLTMLHGVTVLHHHVDRDYWNLYQKVIEVCKERKILATLQAYRESTGREDTAGWKLDHYKTLIQFDEITEPETVILDKKGLEEKLFNLSLPKKRRFFCFS
ncbi:MAG: hypothetical protein V3U87_09030 [Methylococcaceae bacterium]